MPAIRFLQTVGKLRRRQAASMVVHRLRSHFETASHPDDAPTLPSVILETSEAFVPPIQSADNDQYPASGRLTFLNQTMNVGYPPAWQTTAVSRLWEYNLHYHDFLWCLPFRDASDVALDWISRYPLKRHQTGWEPYPTSIRVQNWCLLFFGVHHDEILSRPQAADRLWRSIYHQLWWLERHVEWHLLANHLVENAAALTLAGATFGGRDAARWLRQGVDLLTHVLDDVVLSDGGHVERSPMYQARLCQVLTNLERSGNETVKKVVADPLRRTRTAFSFLSHPDDRIALLNDAAFKVYPERDQLDVERAAPGCFQLPDSGYYGARSANEHFIVCDAGPVGPDYQPGHAHGDTLSFELSLAGTRFVVDTGVYNYEDDEWRAIARSTRAHNTVEINRLDQCDFWSVFRVGRRAYPRNVRYTEEDDGFNLEAEHTGYEHLAGHPVHSRSFRWYSDGMLLVRDHVRSGRDVWARSSIHLHPEVDIERMSDQMFLIRRAGKVCCMRFEGPGRLTVEPSWYFPEFGMRLPNRAIVVTSRRSDIEWGFCVAFGDAIEAFDLTRGARVGDQEYLW